MQITSNSHAIKNLYMKKLSHDEVKKIKQEIRDNINKYTFKDFSQHNFPTKKLSAGELVLKNTQDFQKFLYSNGIDGKYVKRISELNFTQAAFLDIKA